MIGILTLAAIGVAIIAIAATVIYNMLVSARLRVREAWSSIDVQLQRRASLIPNLVEVVKGYASFERDTMTAIVNARTALSTAAGPREAAAANTALTASLGVLFALAEAYPTLKANERYGDLQRDLADTENKIAFARNYYNGAVELYNTRAQSFPALILAGPLGFKPAEFFAAEAAAAVVPQAVL